MANIYKVVVGDKVIYNGKNFVQASALYSRNIMMSREEVGRVAGQAVTLYHNEELQAEFPAREAA